MSRKQRTGSLFVGMAAGERGGVLLLLTTLILGIGAFNLPQDKALLIQIWLAFSAFMIVLALPFIIYRPSWGWLHPLIFWVLWTELIRSVLPKISVYSYGLLAHQAMPDASPSELNAVVVKALLLTTVGLMAMYLGFAASPRLNLPRLVFRPPKHLAVKTSLIAVVSLGAFFFLIAKAGGLGPLMLQRGLADDARIFANPSARIGSYVVGVLESACLVWLALRPKVWKNPIWLAFFIIAIVIGFMSTGSRSGVVMPVLMAGAIWMLYYRRVPYVSIIIGVVFAMSVLGIGGAFRTATYGAASLDTVKLNTSLSKGVAAGFSGMVSYGTALDGTYAVLGHVPERTRFLRGESYLSIPVAPIPSRILPFEKPSAGGALTSQKLFGNPQNTIPPGSIGEAYWNFGVPGVIIIMMFFGAALNILHRLYMKNASEGWVIVIYIVTLFALRPNSDSVYQWLHAIVPVLIIIYFFCGMPKRVSTRHCAKIFPGLGCTSRTFISSDS